MTPLPGFTEPRTLAYRILILGLSDQISRFSRKQRIVPQQSAVKTNPEL